MSFGYGEDLLQFIWEYQLYDQQNLKTDTGESISIIKQGFLNTNSGPDFENAEIKIGNTTHHGSIEIHINEKEWKTHNHHKDPAYNNVILHVCFSTSNGAYREDGTLLPSLTIGERIKTSSLDQYASLMSEKTFIPCEKQLGSIAAFDISIWLDRMIVERLEDRCTLFDTYLTRSDGDWNQAFYVTLVRAFGMPINTASFEDMATRLPLTLILNHQESLFQLEALFFGIAGLLSDVQEDNYYLGLQNEYAFLSKKYGLSTISIPLKFGRMRPMNLPHVKIAQLAAFFHHTPHFISAVLHLPTTAEVEQMLSFELSDYWNTHYSFFKTSEKRKKGISAGFVNHLFLNAIVPFVFFYEKEKTSSDTATALEYLQAIPSEKNSIIAKWESITEKSKDALSSQALLHLYKTYCQPKRCLQCNLGKKILLR